jgi:hypothetical protein
MNEMVLSELSLSFYGTEIFIRSTEAVLDRLEKDFDYFELPGSADKKRPSISILARQIQPDFSVIRGRYLFSHFYGKVYGWGELRYIKYPDALVIFDNHSKEGKVFSSQPQLLYHYTYYLIVSKVGEILDCRGLHRFHALGVSYSDRAALFSMPIKGGKTTLGWEFMKDSEAQLYSEDTPLVSTQGKLHPFPIRFSFRDAVPPEIPSHYVYQKEDPVFGKKLLVDLEYFGNRPFASPSLKKPLFIFLSLRSSLEEPKLKLVGRVRALFFIVHLLVTGKDCPQRAELFLRLSPNGFWMIGKIFCLRFRAAYRLWKNSRLYYFFMTPKIGRNADFIKQFLLKESVEDFDC